MPALQVFKEWFSQFSFADWCALFLFANGLLGYRYFLSFMLKNKPDNLFLGKLQQYRNAWIEAYSGGRDSMVVVQTLRNMIMSASFLASTSIILIMGALNLLPRLGSSGTTSVLTLEAFKILMVIIVLSYSFFNFTWHIREINYMSFILNIPKDKLDEIEGGNSASSAAEMFLNAGIHFSMGIRGYYFLIPLLMWFFSPLLMILSLVLIFYILIRRDLAGMRNR